MRQILVFVYMLFFACCVQQEPINNVVYSEKVKQDILLGAVDRSGFQIEQFRDWFNSEYTSYEVEKETLDSIPVDAWKNMNITIILATWCPDSRRELPRFLKIIDHTGFPEENITYISLNRDKQVPEMDFSHLDIKKVPTMIFYRGDKEIGRIIESPVQSLEKDICKLINN